eukprot:CAMPEP_0179963618 /NCGR_PEP_ID=MMETSP0983-20121128/30878_1 /TAXON_ID=483367 /ORGANISM="non described non described, Strain CCMP 2436" /LENGTH=122 /DNA_ID=CAMNT_0021876263 /DNA_START=1 /DNA_END=369 /DNA_ORIENTATION=+
MAGACLGTIARLLAYSAVLPARARGLAVRPRAVIEFGGGMPRDHHDEAARLFRRAAEQGNPLGQYNLRMSYRIGEGVKLDDREAARLFGLAADQGVSDAQYNNAFCCDEGKGVPQDGAKAAH